MKNPGDGLVTGQYRPHGGSFFLSTTGWCKPQPQSGFTIYGRCCARSPSRVRVFTMPPSEVDVNFTVQLSWFRNEPYL